MAIDSVPSVAMLRIISLVAEHGSFGAAARHLGLSQQAVSERVRHAEKLTELTLFRRTAHGAVITAAGQALIDDAQDIIAGSMRLAETIDWHRDPGHATINCRASQTILSYYLPRWSAALLREHPGYRFALGGGNSRFVARSVMTGTNPLGFVETAELDVDVRNHVYSTPVGWDTLGVVAPPGHPWVGNGEITAEECRSRPLVMREKGSGTRTVVEHALGEFVHPAITVESLSGALAATLATGIPTVAPLSVTKRYRQHGELVHVAVKGVTFKRQLRAVWRKGQPPRGGLAELVDIAVRELNKTR